MTNLNSFKAYDVRGRIPDEINEALAYDIGRAYCAFVRPKNVAVGHDIRLSSPALAAALKRGLMDSGQALSPAVGVLASYIPLPGSSLGQVAATRRLVEVTVACLLVSWPLLRLTGSITAAEGKAVFDVFRFRRNQPAVQDAARS